MTIYPTCNHWDVAGGKGDEFAQQQSKPTITVVLPAFRMKELGVDVQFSLIKTDGTFKVGAVQKTVFTYTKLLSMLKEVWLGCFYGLIVGILIWLYVGKLSAASGSKFAPWLEFATSTLPYSVPLAGVVAQVVTISNKHFESNPARSSENENDLYRLAISSFTELKPAKFSRLWWKSWVRREAKVTYTPDYLFKKGFELGNFTKLRRTNHKSPIDCMSPDDEPYIALFARFLAASSWSFRRYCAQKFGYRDVKEVHRQGKKVFCLTILDEAEYESALNLSLDATVLKDAVQIDKNAVLDELQTKQKLDAAEKERKLRAGAAELAGLGSPSRYNRQPIAHRRSSGTAIAISPSARPAYGILNNTPSSNNGAAAFQQRANFDANNDTAIDIARGLSCGSGSTSAGAYQQMQQTSSSSTSDVFSGSENEEEQQKK